jgi:6,7-dimethyl-8-ribityllumazine synthase|tara:strand:+ start:251 stop:715 length:465 start_codon:yes stop_codon:yes gene_type:complete
MKGLEISNISEKSRQGSYGIVYTSWNADVVQDLLNETKKELLNQGVDEKNIAIKEVPGAFELPLATQFLAEEKEISAVISLGAIIRGDTPHFDFISSACIEGLQNVALKTSVPVICGVLTTNTVEQALERSEPSKMNKGKEFALSAMSMVEALV